MTKKKVAVEAEPQQIPVRGANVTVVRINDEAVLLTITSDQGMQISNWTLTREQVQSLVDGMTPWLAPEVLE